MRVCIVGPTAPFRGDAVQYTRLLRDAIGDRHQVTSVGYKRLYLRRLRAGRPRGTTRVVAGQADCDWLLDPLNPLTWLETASAISQEGCDLLLVNWFHRWYAAQWFAFAQQIRRKTDAFVACIGHDVSRSESCPFLGLWTRLSMRAADVVFVNTDDDAEKIHRMAPRTEVVTTFVPAFPICERKDMDQAEARERLGISGRALLFFGAARRHKGLPLLIEALARAREHRDLSLIIAGQFQHDKSECMREVKRLGLCKAVHVFDQYVPDDEAELYFAAADAVVLPYLGASQSMVVGLAYHFGKPVICTSVGGLCDSVVDGVSGLLVPREDPESLAKAILHLYREGVLEVLREGVAGVASRRSWQSLVETILAKCGPQTVDQKGRLAGR